MQVNEYRNLKEQTILMDKGQCERKEVESLIAPGRIIQNKLICCDYDYYNKIPFFNILNSWVNNIR